MNTCFRCAYILFLIIFMMIFRNDATIAQDDIPVKAPLAVFSSGPRPIPDFDHSLHESTFAEENSCAKCHHVQDNETNNLIYMENEEASCSECHSEKKDSSIPALREASHSSCTGCHRIMRKQKLQAGPITCGECHKK